MIGQLPLVAGTYVMKINATDADEPGNPNSQIAYSLVAQDPPDDMFYMENDGTIYVKRTNLDREVRSGHAFQY